VIPNELLKRHWAKLVVTLMLLGPLVVFRYECLMPDDCESRFRRVEIGMTEPEVNSVMERKNVLLAIVKKRQRLWRASGVSGVWMQEWYEGDGKLIGVFFEWDESGRLTSKAIFKDGEWMVSSA